MLHVDKVDTLLTEKVHVSASRLTPFQCYKFYLTCHYDAGILHSYCVIQADEFGKIDLARDKPIRGTYHVVDPMGLFLSIQPSEQVQFGHYFRNDKAEPFYYTLKLISNSEGLLDQVKLRKLWIHPSVSQIDVAHDGLYGLIFKPPGAGPFPCIIDIPGIGGQLSAARAAIFSLGGFLTYTLTSFAYKELPKRLQDVELETFSKHIRYIQSLPYCSGKIGLYGSSFAGTIAMYLATKHPELSAVVVTNAPESFYRDAAVMRENGKPMECERINEISVYINGVNKAQPCFLDLSSRLRPETSLKWEQISKEIPFRIVASLDDWMMCGVSNCNRIREHLEKTGHKVEVQLVPGGHGITVPYFPHQALAYNKFMKYFFGFGGECSLAAKSHEIVWENHKEFFKKHLGTPPALPEFERETRIILPREGSKL